MMLAKKQNLKRMLASFLALIMLLGLLPTSAFASGYTKQVMDGYFTVTSDGTATEHEGEIPDVTQDGYTVSKNIEQTEKDTFNITLKVQTSETVKTSDAAVMLVIDVSNSMDFCAECGQESKHDSSCPYYQRRFNWVTDSQTRITAAINSAKNFVDTLAANNEGGNLYVSVVKFGTSATKVCDWLDITNSQNLNTVKNAIGRVTVDGGTNLDAGLTLAYNRLGMDDISSASTKYTVLLTDGEPTYYYSGHSTSTEKISDYSGPGDEANTNTINYAVNAASNVKSRSTLYTICYGVGEEALYGTDSCQYCHQPRQNHTAINEGWIFPDWHYYCKDGSGREYVSTMVTVGQYLANEIASVPGNAYNADDTSGLNEAFKNIASSVSEGSSGAGTQVVDPMGQFVKFGQVTSVKGGTADFANNTLSWNLDPTTAEKSSQGGTTTYTFTLTYSVTLDTAAEGFAENVNYPTNGYTRLEVPGADDVVFNVPGVFGTIPEYAYKVEYYKQNADGSGYTLDKTQTGPDIDLHTSIDIADINANYRDEYTRDNYHYVKGDPASITISAVEANNVIKLYYDRDVANVTVNHYYKTDKYAADGTFTAGTYTDQPQTSGTQSGYVGDQFTAEKALNYNGALYTFDKGSDTITVNKDAAKNVINLYYTRSVDERADASVVVNHVYRTHTWTLENGKYVLKEGTQNENKVEESTGLKATTTYTAKTDPVDGYEDFTYDASSVNSITLKEGQNVITLYFDKTVDDRQAVSLTVKHHYTKTVVTIGQDGQPVTTVDPDDHVETVTVEAYKGETVTVSEQNTYGGDTYTSDSGNAAKLTLTDVQGGEEINLYYTIHQAPETTSVTVNHIYRTITHETVETTDDEGNVTGTEVKDSTKTDDTDDVTVNDLYVGQSYTAAQVGREGYTFNEKESDALTAAVQANGATVINLYYDRDEDKDDRDEATISVKHVYTTHLTTIVNGEVKTIDVNDGEETEATVTGKAGDSFTATAKTTYNGKDYTVVGTPDLDVVLQPGTNSTIVINYERSASDLVETGYTVEYIYNTYTMEIVNGVAQYGEPDTEMATTPFNDGYVGQVVTISDGAKDGFTADPANPATTQTLKESGNLYTFVYNKYVPLDKVSVTVNHHYTTTTIAVDGSSSQSTDDVTGTPVEKYVGEDYVAQAAANGFTCDRYTVTDGITATQDETTKNVTLTASGDVVVDFYYSKTVDNSKPVNYSIQHVYVTINWDGTRTVTRGEPITGSSYATKQLSAATDNNGGNYKLVSAYFNDQTMPGFDPADPQDTYAVTLVDGANVIVYTYERNVDTRQSTQVMVIHNYYARDTYTDDDAMSDADYIAQEGVQPEYRTEAVYESFQDGIWVGQEYTATIYNIVYFKDDEGAATIERVYDLVNADPEGGKIASIAALDEGKIPAGNIVTFNLIRDYSTDPGDISYKVIHQYYHNGELVGSVETTGTGKVGSTVNTADITKLTTYNEETYEYVSADKDAITLAADAANNVITLRYESNTSVGPSVTRYDLVVRYLEQGTEEELASAYRTTLRRGDDYDVTSRTEREIDGYVIVDVTGDAVSGTMNGDKEITVWYEADGTDIGDDDTPLGPQPSTDPDDGNNPGGNVPGDGGETDIGEGETPLNPTPDTGNDGTGTGTGTGTAADPGDAGVDIGEGETPLGDLPQTGMAAAPVSPAGTAGLVALSMSMAALGLYFTFGRKKDEEEN